MSDLDNSPSFSLLSSLPCELQRRVFLFVENPANLLASNKAFNAIGKDGSSRVDWLQFRYGKSSHLLEGSTAWLRLVDETNFDMLLRRVAVVPRYVIQRLFHRFQHKNRPDLVVKILTRGLEVYDDLALNKHDTATFRDAYLRNGNLQSFFHLHFSMDPGAETNLDVLEELKTKYDFNVNYCRWNQSSGISNVFINEGYRSFLVSISNDADKLVEKLLEFGVDTHIKPQFAAKPLQADPADRFRFEGVGPDSVSNIKIGKDGDQLAPSWAVNSFPAELKVYLTKTCDAIVLATKYRSLSIMKILLEADLERWQEPHGQLVLENTLQLAVDMNYEEGARLIRGYYVPRETMKKSAPALRKLLTQALRDSHFEDIKTLIYEGACLTPPQNLSGEFPYNVNSDWVSHIYALIENGKRAIVSFLIKNTFFSLSHLESFLIKSIDAHQPHISRLLIRHDTRILTVKVLRRCISKNSDTILTDILSHIFSANPTKLVGGLTSLIKMR